MNLLCVFCLFVQHLFKYLVQYNLSVFICNILVVILRACVKDTLVTEYIINVFFNIYLLSYIINS